MKSTSAFSRRSPIPKCERVMHSDHPNPLSGGDISNPRRSNMDNYNSHITTISRKQPNLQVMKGHPSPNPSQDVQHAFQRRYSMSTHSINDVVEELLFVPSATSST